MAQDASGPLEPYQHPLLGKEPCPQAVGKLVYGSAISGSSTCVVGHRTYSSFDLKGTIKTPCQLEVQSPCYRRLLVRMKLHPNPLFDFKGFLLPLYVCHALHFLLSSLQIDFQSAL
ncbi:uncharacterized protein G2W53_001375 [Senna tora]|uniref:Uncharacterized protein n=1 Tax=Senna tora TaxID=362788 RepID=A0A835CLF8_9FABA|nr:uncharacterized protein G2W53_001375 [Senna tora]